VNFEVYQGEVVTLLGRNGAGKTTTMKSIMGIVGNRAGSVRYEGRELIGLQSNAIARAGIALCPEERGIFASLTVAENLMLPPEVKPGGLSLDRIFDHRDQIGRKPAIVADHPQPHIVGHQLGQVLAQEDTQQTHQVADLGLGPPPILRREGVHGQMLDTPFDAHIDQANQSLHAELVSDQPRHETPLGPPTVAIHDDGNVAGNV